MGGGVSTMEPLTLGMVGVAGGGICPLIRKEIPLMQVACKIPGRKNIVDDTKINSRRG
jgi:hypothetical protein